MKKITKYDYRGFKLITVFSTRAFYRGYVVLPESVKFNKSDISESLNVHGGITFYSEEGAAFLKEPHGTILGIDANHGDTDKPDFAYARKLLPEQIADINQKERVQQMIMQSMGGFGAMNRGKTFKDETFMINELKKIVDYILKAQ